MPNILVVSAANWKNERIICTFTVKVNGVLISPMAKNSQFFSLPDDAALLEVTATPTPLPNTNLYWADTFFLSLAGNAAAALSPTSPARVEVATITTSILSTVLVVVRLSRFKDVSSTYLALLNQTRPQKRFSDSKEDENQVLKAQYGSQWPPTSLNLDPISTAAFIDPELVHYPDPSKKEKGELKFSAPPMPTVAPDVETVVLRLAGTQSPLAYGVTWPNSIPRTTGSASPSMLLCLRQITLQDAIAGFYPLTPAYPDNIDYAERCFYESLHYGTTSLLQVVPGERLGLVLRPKGFPYQIARSGANVVGVYPVASIELSSKGGSYSYLGRDGHIERLLEEINAFMFWRKGARVDPGMKIGKTAISIFSSSAWAPMEWLDNNLAFLKQVTALYILDPSRLDLIPKAIRWVNGDAKRRLRFYGRGTQLINPNDPRKTQDLFSDFHEALGDWSGPHPNTPYVLSARGNTRTAALLPQAAWVSLCQKLGLAPLAPDGWDVHHLIAATMLTHALSQRASGARDL